MKVIKDKQYILDNYNTLAFDCIDKLDAVRNYLEQECGFNRANWDSKNYTKLVYLYVDSYDNNKIHGDYTLDKSLELCSLNYLISQTNNNHDLTNSSVFKSINLREVLHGLFNN